MYAQLGDIVFQELFGFGSLSIKSEQDIAEHALIEGKPRLQNVASKADEMSMAVNINSQFADPEKQYDTLKEYKENANILSYINGAGLLQGEYVITSLELTINVMTPKGQWADIDITISLKECYNTDKQRQAQLDAQRNGFANVSNMPVKTVGEIPISSESMTVMQDVQSVYSNAASVESFIDKAKRYADQANGWMDQAAAKLVEMRNKIYGLNDKISQMSSQYSEPVSNLLNQLQDLDYACFDVQTALGNHDVNNSSLYNNVMQAQMNLMMINSSQLSNFIGIKK